MGLGDVYGWVSVCGINRHSGHGISQYLPLNKTIMRCWVWKQIFFPYATRNTKINMTVFSEVVTLNFEPSRGKIKLRVLSSAMCVPHLRTHCGIRRWVLYGKINTWLRWIQIPFLQRWSVRHFTSDPQNMMLINTFEENVYQEPTHFLTQYAQKCC